MEPKVFCPNCGVQCDLVRAGSVDDNHGEPEMHLYAYSHWTENCEFSAELRIPIKILSGQEAPRKVSA